MTTQQHDTHVEEIQDLLVQDRRVVFSPAEFPIDNCHCKVCGARQVETSLSISFEIDVSLIYSGRASDEEVLAFFTS